MFCLVRRNDSSELVVDIFLSSVSGKKEKSECAVIGLLPSWACMVGLYSMAGLQPCAICRSWFVGQSEGIVGMRHRLHRDTLFLFLQVPPMALGTVPVLTRWHDAVA